jgi:hypothetical protein
MRKGASPASCLSAFLIIGFAALPLEEEGGAALRDGLRPRERLSTARRGGSSHGDYGDIIAFDLTGGEASDGRTLYKARARIEQGVGRLKRFKRVALRCEKTARNFRSIVSFAAGLCLIKFVHTA